MPSTVLVTGISGFIGAHVLAQLLQKGYFVRGTIRKPSQADYFTLKYQAQVKSGQLTFAVVWDIAGASDELDDAVKGVDFVIHVASPFYLHATDFGSEYYRPAIEGLKQVLTIEL